MTTPNHPPPPGAFTPVPVRPRTDGWTPDRQAEFIQALAATANVEAAARAVGMGTSSAYALRARPDAGAFREAWGVALDYAVHLLGEAVLERALHGTATPVFYKGEQVGERRRYDDRLAMFVLRMRDPERFGSWREGRMPMPAGDGSALRLAVALGRVSRGRAGGVALTEPRLLSDKEEESYITVRAEADIAAARRAGWRPSDEDDEDGRYSGQMEDDFDEEEFNAALDAAYAARDAEPDAQGGT